MILSFSEPELHTVYKLPISYLRQVGLRSTNQLQAGRGIQKFPHIAYGGGGGNIPWLGGGGEGGPVQVFVFPL